VHDLRPARTTQPKPNSLPVLKPRYGFFRRSIERVIKLARGALRARCKNRRTVPTVIIARTSAAIQRLLCEVRGAGGVAVAVCTAATVVVGEGETTGVGSGCEKTVPVVAARTPATTTSVAGGEGGDANIGLADGAGVGVAAVADSRLVLVAASEAMPSGAVGAGVAAGSTIGGGGGFGFGGGSDTGAFSTTGAGSAFWTSATTAETSGVLMAADLLVSTSVVGGASASRLTDTGSGLGAGVSGGRGTFPVWPGRTTGSVSPRGPDSEGLLWPTSCATWGKGGTCNGWGGMLRG